MLYYSMMHVNIIFTILNTLFIPAYIYYDMYMYNFLFRQFKLNNSSLDSIRRFRIFSDMFIFIMIFNFIEYHVTYMKRIKEYL